MSAFAPSEPGPRRDAVAGAILGNGSLLVTVSPRGEVQQLNWPHLDHDTHLGVLRLAAVGEGGPRWLDDARNSNTQSFEPDTDVLTTVVDDVAVTDVVDPELAVLVRQVTGLNARLAVYLRPELSGTSQAGGAYLDPVSGVLVAHRRDRVLAIGMDAASRGAVGEHHRGASTLDRLATGELPGGGIAHGTVDGALLSDDEVADVTVAVAFATDREEAVKRVCATLSAGAASARDARREADARTLAEVEPPLVDGQAAQLDRRSQLVFSLLADRQTGGVLAGPEVDPWFQRSGGYGFVWARDLAFIVLAQLVSGRRELAEGALRWLVQAQGTDGLWLQRNWTDGSLAPSWGTQLDETGAVLVAFEQAWQSLGDDGLDRDLWPAMLRGADALVATLDPTTGLPAPSMDLWEERVGVHAFTAATACAGLRAAAQMAERHDPPLAEGWRQAAQRVREGIDTYLWSEERGHYLRSIDVARSDAQGSPTPDAYTLLRHPGTPVPSVDAVDEVVDVSLLGLCYPFGVIAADDPRMAATIDVVSQRLRTADGGLLRYEGDPYIGGNPWVLARLWLGLALRAPGAAVPADGVAYALRAATSTSLLPEQVDEQTGQPVWVVPLTWSHAMFVLACRPDPAGLPSVAAVEARQRVGQP